MGKINRRLALNTAAIASIAGITLGMAAPAHAGSSIPKTYNGGTGISYAYYASTNTFCIDPSKSARLATVSFSHIGTPKSEELTLSAWSTQGWFCSSNLTGFFREDERVRFKLTNRTTGKTSVGYLYV